MRRVVLAVSIALLVLLCSCAPSGAVKTERVDVPMPAERSAEIRLTMRSGDLRLSGAAAGLLEGTVSYAGDGKPAVSTGSRDSTAGKVATVDVEQPARLSAQPAPPVWDLRVNGGLPTDILVSNASGATDLDLSLADPKVLDVTSASGEVSLKLSGPHPSLSRLKVTASSGDVDVAATGEYPALEGFDVDAASGKVSADFSGPWHKDATVRVGAASGDVTIVLPRDVNVAVRTDVASGKVSAEGLAARRRHGGALTRPAGPQWWTRASDKTTPYTLTVEVRVQSGNVTLKVAEKK